MKKFLFMIIVLLLSVSAQAQSVPFSEGVKKEKLHHNPKRPKKNHRFNWFMRRYNRIVRLRRHRVFIVPRNDRYDRY